jgi:hypothetical protein
MTTGIFLATGGWGIEAPEDWRARAGEAEAAKAVAAVDRRIWRRFMIGSRA